MTWKDKLEIGLKDDAPFRRDNLPEFQKEGGDEADEVRQPDDPERSPEEPGAREEAARQALEPAPRRRRPAARRRRPKTE